MIDDDDYIKQISKMTLEELFAEVMNSPEYLTDSYYRSFGVAIRKRYEALTDKEDE